jgi:preprotein translocase subunit Sss1
MLSPEIAKAAFRLALLIVLMAAALLVTLRPGTPEFAVTMLTLLIGLIFVGVIVVFVRLVGR